MLKAVTYLQVGKLKDIILILAILFASAWMPTCAQSVNEWAFYGRDAGGSRYSPLSQVNEATVMRLDTAWTFHTGEAQTYNGTDALSKAAFEATPLMIGGRLYFSTPSDRVFALDASTGKQIWSYDPGVNLHNDFSEITSRGVSVWPSGETNGYNAVPKTVFVATIDGRLIALDAVTGTPLDHFGEHGTINLKTGFGSNLSVTSPAAVIGDIVVVGSSLGDNTRFDETRGVVQAFDVNTGKKRWTWDPVPSDAQDPAWQTWETEKSHQTGAANAWSIISVDAERGLIFIPTSSPSPDYYGGERPGQNLYGNSLVALHATTGKLAWYFQVVHHDLWDYDIAAQPMLVDIQLKSVKTPAVVIGTKMGHIFVLDRLTGKPLFPVEERPVPASSVAGEKAWPTQPFPLKPLPLGLQKVGPDDAWGVTKEAVTAAAKRIDRLTNKGIFTPPSLGGSIMTPGNVGGIHWGGMCFDKQQGLLITNINRLAAVITLIPRKEINNIQNNTEELLRVETGSQLGTPYILKRNYLFTTGEDGFRIQTKPPWGTLLAIDLNSGNKRWEVPLGFMMDPVKFPRAKEWGSINLGGAIVTAGNITLVAASLDGYFRAFNTRTGQLLWEYLLPGGGQATPMSYSVNGKQYIVIAAGGHGKLHTKQGDTLIAFSLR